MQLSEYVEIWDTILFRVYNVIARLKWFVLPWNIKKIVRRNKVFKNKYKGERCFVLLNGPSLKEHDLSALKDEIVFTTNYFYNSTLADVVKPNYHCWLDSLLVSENKDNKLITDIRAKIKNIFHFVI